MSRAYTCLLTGNGAADLGSYSLMGFFGARHRYRPDPVECETSSERSHQSLGAEPGSSDLDRGLHFTDLARETGAEKMMGGATPCQELLSYAYPWSSI